MSRVRAPPGPPGIYLQKDFFGSLFDILKQMIDLRFTTIKQELPDFIFQGIGEFVRCSNDYHHQPDALRRKIADLNNVDLQNVYLTAGADQAISLLGYRYGQSTHIFTPTYVGYGDVRQFGHLLTEHPSLEDGDYRVNTDNYGGATLFFIANPNNPVGVTSRQAILELVKNNPQAKIVVDEAYADFASESVVDKVEENPNLIVIRSFSKGYALAGMRIGYIIAHSQIFEDIASETTWFNVSYPAVGAARVALDNETYFAKLREEIVTERLETEDLLRQKGYEVIPSHINSLLVDMCSTKDAKQWNESLKEAGFLANQGNGGSNIGLDDNFIRIGVGTKNQMVQLRNYLQS